MQAGNDLAEQAQELIPREDVQEADVVAFQKRAATFNMRLLLALSVVFTLAVLTRGAGRAAQGRAFQPTRRSPIEQLPGWSGSLPSEQYTGYIPVHGGDHQLFYWLARSEVSPQDDPVVLWLTGGPGCSSMDALIYENGPFVFSYDQTNTAQPGRATDGAPRIRLERNPYSWTRAATMIYVDSPVGTGLSFSTTGRSGTLRPLQRQRADHMDDESTTDDLVDFLSQLLTKDYPELLGNDLYIAGESYAGVYVPLLATKLLHRNKRVAPADRLNLKGYLIGNGVTDDKFDGDGQPEFAYGLGLLDPPTFTQLRTVCQGSYWNATPGGACAKQLKAAYNRFYWLNPYDILDDCYSSQMHSTPAPTQPGPGEHLDGALQPGARALRALQPGRGGEHGATGVGKAQAARTPLRAALQDTDQQAPLRWPLSGVRGAGTARTWHGLVGHSVPCADRRMSLEWLNQDDVRTALHAPRVGDLDWQPCSDTLVYKFRPISMIPYHQEALDQGLRVLIYSGDHDFVVPFTGTRAWVYSMGLDQLEPYAPWTLDGQVAGFLVTFRGGLQFATVKGAGHMVPQSSPDRALHLFTRFVLKK